MRLRTFVPMLRPVGFVVMAVFIAVFAALAPSGANVVHAADPAVPSGIGAFAPEPTNPATIGMGEPAFRLRLAPFTASFQNNTWPLATYDYWSDKDLPEHVRRKFIDDMPEDGLGAGIDSRHSFVLGVGRFSTAAGVRTFGTVNVAKDVLELLFLGNELNRPYTLSLSGGGAAFADASVAYALPLTRDIHVGVRYHQLLEAVYSDAHMNAVAEIVHTDDEVDFLANGSLRYTLMDEGGETGKGSAFDIGAHAQLSDAVSVGVAVLDVGRIVWPAVLRKQCNLADEHVDGLPNPDELEGSCTETVSELVWRLPRRYELSAGWQMSNAFHLGAAYTLTQHDPQTVFAQQNRSELGTMLLWNRFKFIQLGLGAKFASDGDMSVGAGAALRLGPLQARAHINDLQVLFGKGAAKSFGFGFDLGIVFR